MGKYLNIAKRFEEQQVKKPDAGVEHDTMASPWLCPHCGRPATIEDVFPSHDGERTLTMWSCKPCKLVAVTPDAIMQPPSGWIKRTKQ